jgi:hypothetical protein
VVEYSDGIRCPAGSDGYRKKSDRKKGKILKKSIDRYFRSDNKHGGNSQGAMSRDCETDREAATGCYFVQLGVSRS